MLVASLGRPELRELVTYPSIVVTKIPFRLMLVLVGHQKVSSKISSRSKVCRQHKKLLSSLSPQHQDVTNISDLGYSDCLRIQSGNIDVRW